MSPVVRANWLLALIALLLGAALWTTGNRQRAPAYPLLTSLEADAIHRVKIETGGETVEELERVNGEWRSRLQHRPVKDREWLKHLLHIAQLPSLARFPVPKDLGPYGLDHPRHRLWFDDTLIEWGGLEPLGRRRYVRVGDTVHVISDGFTHHLHPAGAGRRP